MKIRPSLTYYIYRGKEYKLGNYSHGETPNTYYHFISLEETKYSNITLLMREINFAYRTIVRVNVKGCDATLKELIGENAKIWIPPGNPCIEILNAHLINEGGWYEALVTKNEISNIWEERYPVDGYAFPDDLNFKEIIEI